MQTRRRLSDHERNVVAYHEAGHALCAELLPSVDTVHRISIVPRGLALGYTLNLPEEDRYLKTRDELIDHMTMLLGGRAAEEIVFGSITNGAADDLRRVADVAHAMVHEWAMGTGITSMRVSGVTLSESMRRVTDDEVRELADQAMRGATRAPQRPPSAAGPARVAAALPGVDRARRDRPGDGRGPPGPAPIAAPACTSGSPPSTPTPAAAEPPRPVAGGYRARRC